jgi:hypothetical protein
MRISQNREICERVAEAQALLDDHLAGSKHSAAEVVAKAQAVLSEAELLRAMFDVGYFPLSFRTSLELSLREAILSGVSRVSTILTAFQPFPNITCTACTASLRAVAAAQISDLAPFKARTR